MNKWFLILSGIVLLAIVFVAMRTVSDRQAIDDISAPQAGEPIIPADDGAESDRSTQSSIPEVESAAADPSNNETNWVPVELTDRLPLSDQEPRQRSQSGSTGEVSDVPGSIGSMSNSGTTAIPPEGLNPQPGLGIPPEGLSPGGPDSQADVLGPGMTINTGSPPGSASGGELTGPGDAVPILGAPNPGLPGDAPEASDTGIPGLAPEASDPGVAGPAPEDS